MNQPETALVFDGAGWCGGVERQPSPNIDARPDGMPIDLLVIHNISLPPGQFGGPEIVDLFCNRLDTNSHPALADLQGLQVSSHFLIRRDGHIIQFAPCSARAWHAGVSHFAGRDKCNAFSIGIELEGTDFEAFANAQYQTLQTLSAAICQHYPITAICGHEHIAPGRKTDPGPFFDWRRYQQSLLAKALPVDFPFLSA